MVVPGNVICGLVVWFNILVPPPYQYIGFAIVPAGKGNPPTVPVTSHDYSSCFPPQTNQEMECLREENRKLLLQWHEEEPFYSSRVP